MLGKQEDGRGKLEVRNQRVPCAVVGAARVQACGDLVIFKNIDFITLMSRIGRLHSIELLTPRSLLLNKQRAAGIFVPAALVLDFAGIVFLVRLCNPCYGIEPVPVTAAGFIQFPPLLLAHFFIRYKFLHRAPSVQSSSPALKL